MDYSCLTCDKRFYDKKDGVQCDYCDFWIHRKCARLSKEKHDKLVQNSSETWYCNNQQKSTMFNGHKKGLQEKILCQVFIVKAATLLNTENLQS